MTYVAAHKLHSGPSSDHKLFVSHYGTPCSIGTQFSPDPSLHQCAYLEDPKVDEEGGVASAVEHADQDATKDSDDDNRGKVLQLSHAVGGAYRG